VGVELPEHTSASQLNTYASCPRKYSLRYLEKTPPEDRSPSLVLGSVVHSAIGWFFEAKITGESPAPVDAAELARADFAAEVDGPPIRWGRWTPADLLDHAMRLVSFFLEQRGDLPVEDVEQRFTVDLTHPTTGEPLPRPLLGYFDLRLQGGRLVELKTSRSGYKPADLAGNLQFGAYAAAIEALDLESLDVLVLVKSRSPRLQELQVKPSPTRVRWFLDAALAIERAIAAGHFPPAPSWACKTCEYRSRCLGHVVQSAA